MQQAAAGPKTYPVLPVAAPDTIVLWCGDPRFQEAVRQFLEVQLGLKTGTYVPVTLAGGAASLSEPLSLPKEFKFLRETFEFFLEHFATIKRVILINHEECGKYKALHEKLGASFLHRVEDMVARQTNDLGKVASVVAGLVSRSLTVEQYYARFANPEHTQVVFEKQ